MLERTNRAAPNSILAALAVDGSGNVFVAGDTTIKYSNAGSPIWSNNLPFRVNAMALDNSGNMFMSGGPIPQNATNEYYATMKYSNAGVPLWTNRYNLGIPGQSREVRAIAVDSSGNVFVIGDSSKTTDVDYGTIAYSNSGLLLWTDQYNGPANAWDVARAVAVDANGNVFVTGYSTTGDPTYGYPYDYATIKYSNSGVPLWTNYYGGPAGGADYATSIAVDSAGNVFVTGFLTDVPCCPGSYTYATVAYSNSGELLWENRHSSDGPVGPLGCTAKPTAIAVDSAENVIVSLYSGCGGNSPYSTTIKYSSSLPPPVQLDFQRLNNQLVLSWTNSGFTLQSSPFATGTFTNIPGATSPYTNSFAAPRQFFRLISN